MPIQVPKNWMEFWYLLITVSLVPVAVMFVMLVVFAFIAENMDTEYFVVGGGGTAAGLGVYFLHKWEPRLRSILKRLEPPDES